MLDREEKDVIYNREYVKTKVADDENLSNGIDTDTNAYLNGLTDFQILQLQKELKASIGDGLVKKYTKEESSFIKKEVNEYDHVNIESLQQIKDKYKTKWQDNQTAPHYNFQQEFDLPETEYTEDQLLTALSSQETTLIAHSLGYLNTIKITNWNVLTRRILPLLVHRSKMVRLRAYKILYRYDSLPVAVIDLLRKSKFDDDLAQEVLQELQS